MNKFFQVESTGWMKCSRQEDWLMHRRHGAAIVGHIYGQEVEYLVDCWALGWWRACWDPVVKDFMTFSQSYYLRHWLRWSFRWWHCLPGWLVTFSPSGSDRVSIMLPNWNSLIYQKGLSREHTFWSTEWYLFVFGMACSVDSAPTGLVNTGSLFC